MSIDHVCGIAVRNPQIISVTRYYGLTVATCVPADPQSKGGSEATVRIAKADLVPTEHNLQPAYADFAELERACVGVCERVNLREHRMTRRPPVVMLAEERDRLHQLPAMPHTVAFGETRRVSWQSTISVGGALYSVPSKLVDERVWARTGRSELVVVHADGQEGPREIARHQLTTPGQPSIQEAHYPPRPAGALERKPRAQTVDEEAFLQIGSCAERWLIAAAAAGTTKLRRKVVEAVALAKLHGDDTVDEALRAAADAGRFANGDLAANLGHQGAQSDRVPRAHERRAVLAALDRGLGRVRRMTVKTPQAPPLPAEVKGLLRRLRMPYVRKAAPEVLATAKAQRWDPAEVLKVLVAEEAAGRDQATIRMRHRQPGLPAGKTFEAWNPDASPIPKPTPQSLQTLEWSDRAENLCICGPSGTGKIAPGRSARAPRSTKARPSPGTRSNRSRR